MQNKDKVLHFCAGIAVATIVVSIAAFWERNTWWLAAGAVGSSCAIGAAKELYDELTGKGCSEWLDLIATAFGGVLVATIVVTCF
jgi:hypothetical protein